LFPLAKHELPRQITTSTFSLISTKIVITLTTKITIKTVWQIIETSVLQPQ